MVVQKIIKFSTIECKITDLTMEIQDILTESGVKMGTINIFNVGSTAAISTIEFENGLIYDFPVLMEKLIPTKFPYEHNATWGDDNGHSHLRATLMGPSITVPFKNYKLITGTWQQIIHIEFDHRPREREVIVTIIGE